MITIKYNNNYDLQPLIKTKDLKSMSKKHG